MSMTVLQYYTACWAIACLLFSQHQTTIIQYIEFHRLKSAMLYIYYTYIHCMNQIIIVIDRGGWREKVLGGFSAKKYHWNFGEKKREGKENG